MVISARVSLVSEEVDFLVLLQKPQTVSFVPTDGKHVKTDLTSDRILHSQIRELFLKGLNKLGSDSVFLVVLLIVISFALGTVSTDGGDVDEPRSVLDESASLDRNVDVCDVVEAESDELFEFVLSQEVSDALYYGWGTDLASSSVPLIATKPFSLKK